MRKLLLFVVFIVFISTLLYPLQPIRAEGVLCKVVGARSATWAKEGFLPSTVDFALVSQIARTNAYRDRYPLDGKPDWMVNGVHVVPNWQWVGLLEFYRTPRPTDESKIAVVRVAAQADWPNLYFVFVYKDWTQDHPACGFWVSRADFNSQIRIVWL